MSDEGIIHIVDDDKAVREGLGFMLSSLGLAIETHSSASDLLERLDGAVIGCILADVRMPGMTGLELLDELKRRGCAPPGHHHHRPCGCAHGRAGDPLRSA